MKIENILERKGRSVRNDPPHAPVTMPSTASSPAGIGALVVSLDGETVLGVIAERDVCRPWLSAGPPPSTSTFPTP